MNKLFGLFLLALAFLAPGTADAANRFAVCTTTCTWDNTSTAMWSTTTGGATGASAPTSTDVAILDAATCVGGTTCTITTFAGTISLDTLTMDACTASTAGCILAANTNNTNFNITNTFSSTGAGTRTLSMGTGTWTFSSGSSLWNVAASLTLNASSSTIAFSSTAAALRQTVGAGKTYGTISIAGSANGLFIFNSADTIGTLTISAPNRVQIANNLTITTLTNTTGTSSTPVLLKSNGNGVITITSANNWTCTWCGFALMTFTGGGTFSATNSLNFGDNTGITITPPSVGGGGGGRIIGG